jgi:hypothetical protein
LSINDAQLPASLDPEAEALLQELGAKTVHYMRTDRDLTNPVEGPYILSNKGFHKVSRLYPDTAEAFIVSTIQSDGDPFLLVFISANST